MGSQPSAPHWSPGASGAHSCPRAALSILSSSLWGPGAPQALGEHKAGWRSHPMGSWLRAAPMQLQKGRKEKAHQRPGFNPSSAPTCRVTRAPLNSPGLGFFVCKMGDSEETRHCAKGLTSSKYSINTVVPRPPANTKLRGCSSPFQGAFRIRGLHICRREG